MLSALLHSLLFCHPIFGCIVVLLMALLSNRFFLTLIHFQPPSNSDSFICSHLVAIGSPLSLSALTLPYGGGKRHLTSDAAPEGGFALFACHAETPHGTAPVGPPCEETGAQMKISSPFTHLRVAGGLHPPH